MHESSKHTYTVYGIIQTGKKRHTQKLNRKRETETHLNEYRDHIKENQRKKNATNKRTKNVGAEITIKMKNIFLIN